MAWLLVGPSSAASDAGPLKEHVIDPTATLQPQYAADLSDRLERYSKKTGYGIYIVVLRDNAELKTFAMRLFASDQLELLSPAGTVALLVARQDKEARIATSENLNRKFLQPESITAIEVELRRVGSRRNDETMEYAVEYSLEKIIQTVNPWFYVLDPPSGSAGNIFHPVTAEVVLFPLAPFSALMVGMILMALTPAGSLGSLARLILCSLAGSAIAITAAFLFRQPGGLVPGALFYAAAAGFTVSGVVGVLRPIWFADKFTGKRSDAWWSGPVHFHWG
jgi:uncharacterized membrane protein YgcG